MTERKNFILVNERVLGNAVRTVREAPAGYVVTISPPKRSLDQNAKLHALLSDLAASPVKWAGKRRTLEEWKALMISAHAVATGRPGEVVPGIEGEYVAIRESSANMGVGRAASLITYLLAFCDTNHVDLHETRAGGFMDEVAA